MEQHFSELHRLERAGIEQIVEHHMQRLATLLDSEAGFRGLYGGLTQHEVRARKSLSDEASLVDWMSPEELAANIFCVSQTEARLRREHSAQAEIDNLSHLVGQTVRRAIAEVGGIMPEDLPAPGVSMRQRLQEELLALRQYEPAQTQNVANVDKSR